MYSTYTSRSPRACDWYVYILQVCTPRPRRCWASLPRITTKASTWLPWSLFGVFQWSLPFHSLCHLVSSLLPSVSLLQTLHWWWSLACKVHCPIAVVRGAGFPTKDACGDLLGYDSGCMAKTWKVIYYEFYCTIVSMCLLGHKGNGAAGWEGFGKGHWDFQLFYHKNRETFGDCDNYPSCRPRCVKNTV